MFGSGCGVPPLDLQPAPTALPRLQTTALATLTNVPAGLAFLALGWSRTSFGAVPLPRSLQGFGLPGCDQLQSAEVVFAPVVFTTATSATFSLPIPNDPGLVDLRVFLQGWALAPGANPGQVVVSNGVDWSIGR